MPSSLRLTSENPGLQASQVPSCHRVGGRRMSPTMGARPPLPRCRSRRARL
jgi:hypothetical protein